MSRQSSPPSHSTSNSHGTLRRPASHSRLSQLMVPGRSRSGSTTSQASISLEDGTTNSGRASPDGRRRTGKAAATSLLANDSKYKKFRQQVDKCLQSFESVNEWADFISFLSRLLKTLQSQTPSYNEIPRKLIVAKRLAQCLNPALPSGVHQRALDVYIYIFSIIGTEGLQRDLTVWSSGLFPFFQYAATSVRPLLINIYETYYLPLGEDLRPATKAFTLALLPGIEEESGDFFDKILFLLDRLSEAITPSFFLQNMFLILITSPASRHSALNYLARRMLKPSDHPDAFVETGLLIRGLSAALDDENVLVRRNALDLLLRVLKMESEVLKAADPREKNLLIRSATNVVLQKELSLSRRVYTWLLGPGDTSQQQVEYFKSHALDLLATAILTDMEDLVGRDGLETDGDVQRPFKVLLSLWDKWEVGIALSERVAVPALRIIMGATQSGSDEVISTAVAIYDAVEPAVIWKLLYAMTKEGIQNNNQADLDLVFWILDNVQQHDEEVTQVHIPVLLDSVLQIAQTESSVCAVALDIAVSLIKHIPSSVFSRCSPLNPGLSEEPPVTDILYDGEDKRLDAARIHTEVLPRIVITSFSISEAVFSDHSSALLNAIRVISILIDHEVPALATVNGPLWLDRLVAGLKEARAFSIVEALVVVALDASRGTAIKAGIADLSDDTMSIILDSLFRYLQPSASLYHARAVELLWDYNQIAEIHSLETVIARRLTSKPFDPAAFEAFGIFWRFTDDSMLPGEIFNVPICIVLESLKSPDPNVQREAETWLRLNLSSYFRVLDPILSRLLDPLIKYDISQGTYDGKADLNMVKYQIECISALFEFGGQGLSKVCTVEELKSSVHSSLVDRSEKQFPDVEHYLHLIVLLLIRFVDTEASPQMGRNTAPQAMRVQSASLSLLQTIISRGDIPQHLLVNLKSSLVRKLLAAVRSRNLTLQNKMLHLLHSAIMASTQRRESSSRLPSQIHRRGNSSITEKPPVVEPPVSDFEHQLVAAVLQGVSAPSNVPVLQHWVDFVLMTVPLLASRPTLLHTLAECFSQTTRELVQRIRDVYDRASTPRSHSSEWAVIDEKLGVTDVEVIMTLNALERVLTILGNQAIGRADEVTTPNPGEGSSRILGLVSTVFTVEAPTSDLKAESPRYLDDSIHALLVTWSVTLPDASIDGKRVNVSSSHRPYDNIRSRARKVLEKTFRVQPLAVMSSCVHVWSLCSEQVTDEAIFDCIDTLTPNAQRAVELLCELASGRSGRASIPDYRADPSYLAFLEAYVSRLEAPIAVQVWTTLFAFARDVSTVTTSAASRSQLLPLLRCLTGLALIVSKTPALEDKRLRRDLQDTYAKLLDMTVANSSKIAEMGIWDRLEMAKAEGTDGGEGADVEKGLEQLYDYLSFTVIPGLRVLLVEPDRVNSACSGITVTIVGPAFRRQKIGAPILRLVLQISHISSAIKTWRPAVYDLFSDSRLFKSKPPIEVAYWKTLVLALFDSDRERFPDLLSRITSVTSANINIFTNREQEMAVKCGNLRRLSLVLLAAERNHYLGQLPGIQERLVEMLRSGNVSARVHSEVYLCLRVLMCRISPQHLTNFWPVILAELLRIFNQTMDEPPEDGSEGLQLVLAACKFLDLLLVLQSEDFQIHQWMFVTDTTDAAYPSEEYLSDSIMDRLADLLSDLAGSRAADTMSSSNDALPLTSPTTPGAEPFRRPRLSAVKTLESLRQLQPFFARASIDTFESVYANSGIDWEVVEESMTEEIFDSV